MSDMQGPFDANAPLEHDHELTDEDRAYAVEAANAWAQAQSDPEEPAPEGDEDDTQRQAREKRNADRQARRKPDRSETDEQRQAREKRNADHNERAMQPQSEQGTYTTRAPGRPARQPEQPKR